MATDSDNEDSSRSQSPEVSGDQETGDMIKTENQDNEASNGHQSNNGTPEQPKKPSNAKDPSRPRRKKARRACYACQRAHLTCGDERPCQRCIKRGLQDACQDGVRKKAKYLHDAPNEALLPGASSHYQYLNHIRQTQGNPQNSTYQLNPISEVYAQVQPSPSYAVYNNATTTGGQIPMSESLMNAQAYSTQQSPVSQTFPSAAPPPTSMQGLVQAMVSAPQTANATVMQDFGGSFFDGQDMSQFNFDPASFNFGNHYGALEFGMLGHMSSGADTILNDTSQMNQASLAAASAIPSSYADQAVTTQPYMFGQDQTLSDWRPPTQPQSNVRQQDRLQNNYHTSTLVNQDAPTAFSIGANSAFASPTSESGPTFTKTIDELQQPATKPIIAPNSSMPASRPSSQSHGQGGTSYPHQQAQPQLQTQPSSRPQQQQQQQQQQSSSTASWPLSRHHHRRRRGDPSSVYSSVMQPYNYTSGFHSLIAFLQRRFSTADTVRIAKALAAIRPSFLSCTQNLGREDLIFMEKCFQRQLWEYEEFIGATGTPTLVCRRTGEVAAVGKEFSILTGWKKDILLGKEANLNVNTGSRSSSSTGSNTSGAGNTNAAGSGSGREPASESASAGPPSRSGGLATPRLPPGTVDTSRPQPVFLAELLDDESVIAFYEDFARLAFGDARGGVVTRCKLLKYRSKEDVAALTGGPSEGGEEGKKRKRERTLAPAGEVSESANGGDMANGGSRVGGVGIDELGDEYGKVESMCTWFVKRDLFDLPMMIVMNFLPCI